MRLKAWTTLAALLLVGAVSATVDPVAASTPARLTIKGEIPPSLSGSKVTRTAVPLNMGLDLVVALDVRSRARLVETVDRVSDPASPDYGRYLTQAEANRLFNPLPSTQHAVEAWLRSQDLQVTRTFSDHLAIDVSGSVGAIQHAFHVRLRWYQPSPGNAQARYFAPAQAPSVPAKQHSILAVLGLDNLQPHRAAVGIRDRSPPYYPQDFVDAYDIAPLWKGGYDGRGQRIGITLDTPPPSDSTLRSFAQLTGVPMPTRVSGRLHVVKVDGGNAESADIEAAMDTEYSAGIAPGATIDFYQAREFTDPYLYDALHLAGDSSGKLIDRQITNSWGECENTSPATQRSEEELFAAAATTGHDFLFASGDQGSYCAAAMGTQDDPFPNFPADSPYVTSVGGTGFHGAVAGGYPGEWAWPYDPTGSSGYGVCDLSPCPEGSGGGFSRDYGRPSYQRGIVQGTRRGYPDVSVDADPTTGAQVCVDASGCYQIGGTSLSSPLWAGVLADINQYVRAHGASTGFINPALYYLAAHPHYTVDFHDINLCHDPPGRPVPAGCTNGFYDTGKGWDAVTGLGTPRAFNLVRDLLALKRPAG